MAALYQFSLVVCDDGFFLKRDKKKQTKLDLQKNEKKKNFIVRFLRITNNSICSSFTY